MIIRIVVAFLTALAVGGLPRADAAELFYGFDDGTFEGWQYMTPDGGEFPLGIAVNGWVPSTETIDIGDGFTLVPATSGDFRVVPFPWDTRDCLGGPCETQILRSPEFHLDGSGDISIDMIGGQLRGGTTDAAEEDFPLEVSDLPEFRTADAGVHASQGFALRDALSDEYLLFGFSDVENDGKMRASDPPSRADWQTVSISQDDLAPFANNGQAYTVDIYDSYLGGWGWIGFDSVRIPGTLAGGGLDCDFDASGVCDIVDLDDLLYTGLGTTDAKYDLDGSGGEITLADRDAFLSQLNSFPGDFDLDGQVVAGDLNILGGNWQQTGLTSYADGDANGDGTADARDLNDLGSNWQRGAAAASAVPEPSAMLLFMSGFVLLGLRRR